MPWSLYEAVDMFLALGDPTRRLILGELWSSPRSVNDLVDSVGASQPTISKHLRVLREAGFVSRQGIAQQRIYRLEPARFQELDAWLDPYRRLWKHDADAREVSRQRTGSPAR